MSTEKEKSQRKFNFLNKIQESAKINKEKKNRRKWNNEEMEIKYFIARKRY